MAQADIVVSGTGTYTVLDTAGAIETEVTDTTAGSLDGATSVAATDSDSDTLADTVTLTVSEYGQIVDGDTTLTTPYRIVDTAANIQNAIADDGSSLGAIAGAVSAESSDANTLTFKVAEVNALNGATPVSIMRAGTTSQIPRARSSKRSRTSWNRSWKTPVP